MDGAPRSLPTGSSAKPHEEHLQFLSRLGLYIPWKACQGTSSTSNILMPLIHTLFRVVSRCKLCMQEQAIEDLKQAHSQRLAKMEGQNKWLSKRVAVLSDQMGWLCEASLRHVEAPHACMQVCPRSLATLRNPSLFIAKRVACRLSVRGLHGNEAAEQLYVNSLQGLSVLLLPRDVPVRMRLQSCTHTRWCTRHLSSPHACWSM